MISVIVPIYNTSRFLKTCIESILDQTFKDIEIILINDGSTDRSLSICKRYESKDHRIVVVNKTNEGVDKARFYGLKIAKGEYITFVDSDDWLKKDALKIMYDKMIQYKVDYVEIGIQRVMDRFQLIKKKSSQYIHGYICQPVLFDKYYLSYFGYNILSVNMCGKLYRKEVLINANLSPSNLKMGEDLFFNLMLFPHLKSIYISNFVGYNYRFGGITSNYNPHLYPNLKFLYNKKKELIKQYNYYKALPYIQYELVNIFKSDVIQKIRYYNRGCQNKIIQEIQDEINDKCWEDLLTCPNKKYLERSLPKAILHKDYNSIYSLGNQEVNKGKLKRYFLVTLSKMLKYL